MFASLDGKYPYVELDRSYHIRDISTDQERQDEYQRLRADILIKGMGWRLPVDDQGRERDRYDIESERFHVSVYGAYGQGEQTEHFLGGVRLLTLQSWETSMLMNEFFPMFPTPILRTLAQQDARNFLEITRFCVRRGRWYPVLALQRFSCAVARDLTYAAVYAAADQTQRFLAVGVADPQYMRIMQRANFCFRSLCIAPGGTLVIIDLRKTIRCIRAAGDDIRVRRMLSACPSFGLSENEVAIE